MTWSTARVPASAARLAPGIAISADALIERAARIARVDLRMPDHAIGRDTATSSMRSGTMLGAKAAWHDSPGASASMRTE